MAVKCNINIVNIVHTERINFIKNPLLDNKLSNDKLSEKNIILNTPRKKGKTDTGALIKKHRKLAEVF